MASVFELFQTSLVFHGLMIRRLSLFSLLLAWLCANGAFLEVAQCVAWAKMFVGYVPTMTVGQAMSETFDPAKPCALCNKISAARQKQSPEPTAAVASTEKMLLAMHVTAKFHVPQLLTIWPWPSDSFGANRSACVLLQPPRLSASSAV